MNTPIVLTCLSDAGGVGKTTLAVNVAYEWSLKGYSVIIIDLDSNHSLDSFVKLTPAEDEKLTSFTLFDKNFTGNYPTKSVFESKFISVIQGTQLLKEVGEQLVSRKLKEYTLAKVLRKYPLNVDLIIFDCRAGFDVISENALAASSHVLIPFHMGVKALTVSNLVSTIWSECIELELEPMPEILGLVPNRFDQKLSDKRKLLSALKNIAEELEINFYSPLREWQWLEKAAIRGKPLRQFRSGDPMNLIFAEIASDLERIKQSS